MPALLQRTEVKVGISLLILAVRLYSKLGVAKLAPGGLTGMSLPDGSITMAGLAVAGLCIAYYFFEKALKPMSWRSKWAKKGVPVCPDWQPVLGNYKALSNVMAKAKQSSEPYQEPYTLLAKEYFCDEKGVYEPLVALNTPYGDHLVINQIEVAE